MDIRLLGDLEVLDDAGRIVTISGAKLRALLAVLALRAGRAVSASQRARSCTLIWFISNRFRVTTTLAIQNRKRSGCTAFVRGASTVSNRVTAEQPPACLVRSRAVIAGASPTTANMRPPGLS